MKKLTDENNFLKWYGCERCRALKSKNEKLKSDLVQAFVEDIKNKKNDLVIKNMFRTIINWFGDCLSTQVLISSKC